MDTDVLNLILVFFALAIKTAFSKFFFLESKKPLINYYTQKQPPEVFCKKGVLRHFAKFTGKHLCQSPFLKGLWYRCFPVNFAKFLNTHFHRTRLGDCFFIQKHEGLWELSKLSEHIDQLWSISTSSTYVPLSSKSTFGFNLILFMGLVKVGFLHQKFFKMPKTKHTNWI